MRRIRIDYPEELEKLAQLLPELHRHVLKPPELQDLWRVWSDSRYAAGWMNVTPERVAMFLEWLNEGGDVGG